MITLFLLISISIIYADDRYDSTSLRLAWEAAAAQVKADGVHKSLYNFYFGLLEGSDYASQDVGSNRNGASFPRHPSGSLIRILGDKKIRVGTENLNDNFIPPFYAKVGSFLRGFDIDYCREVVSYIGAAYGVHDIEIEFVQKPDDVSGFFDGILAGLQRNIYDVYGLSVTINDARAELVDFSEVSSYRTFVAVMVNEANSGRSLEELQNDATLKVGFALGSTAQPVAEAQFPNAELIPADVGIGGPEGQLKNGDVDAIIGDYDTIRFFSVAGAKVFTDELTSGDFFGAAFLKPGDYALFDSSSDDDDDDSSSDDDDDDDDDDDSSSSSSSDDDDDSSSSSSSSSSDDDDSSSD